MLKKVKKRIKQQRLGKYNVLTVAVCTFLTIASSVGYAADNPLTILDSSKTDYTLTENIYTSGGWGIGILASTGIFTIDLGNLSVNTVSKNGIGIYQSGVPATATVTVRNGSIITESYNNHGVYTYDGTLYLENVGITSKGESVTGIYADKAIITMAGGSINTEGKAGSGAIVKDGTITLKDGTNITTKGESAAGLYAIGGTIDMTGGSISTEGKAGTGAITNGGTITLKDGTNITTKGESAAGLYSIGGTIDMTGGSIKTEGKAGTGAIVKGGTITLKDSTNITTKGESAAGLYAIGGTINMTGSSIKTEGEAGTGAIAQGGTITLNNTNVTTQGVTASGLFATGSGSKIKMTGGGIQTYDPSSNGSHAKNGGEISLTNVGIQSAGTALRATNGSSLNVSIDGQAISGHTELLNSYGGTINITANDSSQLYGTANVLDYGSVHGTANLTLNNKSTWANPDNSTITNLTLNNSAVAFTSPTTSGYKALSLAGNLSGTGGIFAMNANLTTGQSDTLSIGGTASGNYQLRITRQGNASSELRQAVKVVDINESVDNTATFSGGSDFGAYRYAVTQGSLVPAGISGVTSSSDYYFYNSFMPSTAAAAAIDTAAATNSVWYGEMNDIRKRMGELRLGSQSNKDIWVRTYADKFQVEPSGSHTYEQKIRGIELGKDKLKNLTDGKEFTGFLLGSGKADNHFSTGATGNTNSFYLGAYNSWLKNDGSYVDLIGKYNWFRHKFDAPLLGESGIASSNYRNKALGLSIEIGKQIEQGGGFFIEPQAELSAMWSTHSKYRSTNGLNVEVPSARSLQLRLGSAFGKKTVGNDGTLRQVYGKLAWVHEYAGSCDIIVNEASFDSDLKGDQFVTGFGFMEDSDKHQLYLDVEKSWGNAVSKPWGVNLGCRWKL